jgi:hypothetical protein
VLAINHFNARIKTRCIPFDWHNMLLFFLVNIFYGVM